jgi:hypothetical protein
VEKNKNGRILLIRDLNKLGCDPVALSIKEIGSCREGESRTWLRQSFSFLMIIY